MSRHRQIEHAGLCRTCFLRYRFHPAAIDGRVKLLRGDRWSANVTCPKCQGPLFYAPHVKSAPLAVHPSEAVLEAATQ